MPHGTRTSYVRGCKCDACREANTDYWRLYTMRRPDVAEVEQAPKKKRARKVKTRTYRDPETGVEFTVANS